MNLFGHAAVASWRSSEPSLALGAMLPDLVGLARVRAPTPLSEPTRAGIELHHETDRIFHSAGAFVSLCARAIELLQERGVPRAAARATAHVGVELLLDGELTEDERARARFQAALELTSEHLDEVFAWRDGQDAARVCAVGARLLGADIPDAYRDPDRVAERVYRILARRPRLAFPEAQLPAVRDWARAAQIEVRAVTPELLAAVGAVTSR